MKRRDFLKTAGLAGVSAGVATTATSCSENTALPRLKYYRGEIKEKHVLQTVENIFLKLTVYSDASFEITDKQRNVLWKTGPVAMQEEGPLDVGHVWIRHDRSVCEQYPARFVGEAKDDCLEYTMLGRQQEVMGKIRCQYILDKDEIVFKLLHVDEQIPSLVFPPPIFSESLILPASQGLWIKKPFNEWHRYVYKLYSHINMRWFGGLQGDKGWMAIFEEGWADSCITGMALTLSSGWLKSLNRWTPRSLRYCFTENGYIGMAKRYRRWAIEKGLFRSLREKVQQLPQLNCLIGGRLFIVFLAYAKRREKDIEEQLIPLNDELRKEIKQAKVFFTFHEAGELFQEAKRQGLKKGALYLAGWIKDGYDASHPDVWPPEPLLGSIDDLKKACGEEGSYFTMLHDNYQDIYETSPSFPKGVNINLHGRLMTGGIWSERQCYILNSKNSLEYAKRNWEKLKDLGQKGMYIDTTTTMQLFESFEPGNTQTRLQDFERKCELVKFYYDQGMVFGSEQIGEISLPHAAFGFMHGRELYRTPGERIPLWHLAFHDACLVMSAYHNPRTEENKTMYDKRLEEMLYGCAVTTSPGAWASTDSNAYNFARAFESMKNSMHVDRWHEQIAMDEMVSHRFLTDDFLVEETEFSSGRKIICNFGDTPRVIDGKKINAYDYLIVS